MTWTLRPAAASQPFDVVAFGENSVDLVGVTAQAIAPGGKVALDRLLTLVGGQAATAAVACARQGLRVRYAGAVGTDDRADLVRRTLLNEGIDVVAGAAAGALTRTAVVLVDSLSGERTVFEHRDPALAIAAGAVSIDALVAGRVLLLDATYPDAATAIARAARAAGIPTMVDVDRVETSVTTLLRAIDVIVVPAAFLRTWSGEEAPADGLAKLAATFRPALAVVTLGQDGSLALLEGQQIRTPGFHVAVADTTGAGDAFRGGFASAWLKLGEKAHIEDVLLFANATAALNCRSVGAMSGLPDFADVAALVTATRHGQSK